MANQQEQQMLAAFIQWLPKNIAKFQGQIPDEVITPIANAKSDDEVVNVLNQLAQSEEGNQLVSGMFQAFQQSQNQGLFKEGGKLAYGLKKFQRGAKFNPNVYNTVIHAPGDTTYTKPYKYSTEERQTYPDGSVRLTTFTKSDSFHRWDPNAAAPSFLHKLLYGNRKAGEETLANWRQLLINHKNDPNIKDKTK